ncbi:recombination protein O N-terminal domain-containing protein, partial [Candidatus Pelagibacter sp.]|nr:recombination protein O N-terminal domain-containing protein [Candidatus Pelagibacter sp.]
MNWQDKGYLLSKNKYNENSVISEFYTENHGKISGIIFGGTSKKIKNYLIEGNKLHINYNSKSQSKIGSLKIEIDEFKTP